jgi:hypothetical protein
MQQMKESGGLRRLVALITDQPVHDDDSTKKGGKGEKGGSRTGGKKSATGKDRK